MPKPLKIARLMSIGVLVGATYACHGPGEGDVSGVLAIEGSPDAGQPHFVTCSLNACHGLDGNTGDGPELRGEISPWSDEELARIIKFGIGSMDGVEGLDDQEIADLMAYLRQRYP